MIEDMYAEMNKRKLNNSHLQGSGASLRMMEPRKGDDK